MGWWIALGILAVILLLLWLPLRLEAVYDGGCRVRLRWLFLRFGLLGYPKPTRRRPKKTGGAAPAKKPKKPFRPAALLELVRTLAALLRAAIPPLRWLLRHTTLIRLTARLSMGGEDAAEAALSAGRMQGVLHGLLALLRNAVRVPPRAEILLAIAPDYLSDSSEGRFGWRWRSVRPCCLPRAAGRAYASCAHLRPGSRPGPPRIRRTDGKNRMGTRVLRHRVRRLTGDRG